MKEKESVRRFPVLQIFRCKYKSEGFEPEASLQSVLPGNFIPAQFGAFPPDYGCARR
jgi:hypothetical protein